MQGPTRTIISALRHPPGVAIIGGLIASQMLTLFTTASGFIHIPTGFGYGQQG